MRKIAVTVALVAFQAHAQQSASQPTPLQNAMNARGTWLSCVRVSAARYAVTPASPQDVADAALAECQQDRAGYEAYYSQIIGGGDTIMKLRALMADEDTLAHRTAVLVVLQGRYPPKR